MSDVVDQVRPSRHAHGTTGETGTRNRRVVSAGSMTGDSVRNLSGDDLGNV